jgi:hypothetical protein
MGTILPSESISFCLDMGVNLPDRFHPFLNRIRRRRLEGYRTEGSVSIPLIEIKLRANLVSATIKSSHYYASKG